VVKLPTIYGDLDVPDWGDDLIFQTLNMYGEWVFSEQLLLATMVRETDALWDVGAFLGTFGLGVSQLAPKPPAHLVSIEPGQVLRPFLAENLQKNAPCPSQIAPFAVAQSDGWLRPQTGGQNNAGAIAYEHTDEEAAGTVPCRSLASLRAEFGDYDVLKLDVEGMENEAVLGDIEFIKEHRPTIWAECNDDMSSLKLLETLIWLNYEPVYVGFPFFRNANFNQSQDRIFPMAYEAVLLAAPQDRLADFTGKVDGEDIIVRPVKTGYDLRRALWAIPRWSLQEWTDMSRPELIALLGRQHQKQELAEFLNS
jgi:FkbM family methyltransferase